MKRSGNNYVEAALVIAIVMILTAILWPVFVGHWQKVTKEKAKAVTAVTTTPTQ